MPAPQRSNFNKYSIALATSSILTDDEKWAGNECEIMGDAEYDDVFPDPPRIKAKLIFPDSIIDWLN